MKVKAKNRVTKAILLPSSYTYEHELHEYCLYGSSFDAGGALAFGAA